ncbi:hypothetical protein [Pseudomonas sp. 1152_12]|uniref:hypothetical protein n=1 Tax=Pseudomonas sp. 1152_12 TaxID=2604455 RepID=UPI0040636AF8
MSNISSHTPTQPRLLLPQPASSTYPPTRQKRDASESTAVSRIEGDREIAINYSSALLGVADQQTNVKVYPVPSHSTFGQWWTQLRNAFQLAEVRQWIEDTGINAQSIRLNAQSGQLSYTLKRHLDPKQIIHTVGLDDSRWAAVSGPILEAGRVIAAGNANTVFAPPTSIIEEPVPYEIVGLFYKERLDLTEPAMRKRVKEIAAHQGFAALDPTTDSSLIASRSEDALMNQKAFMGDINNRETAAYELKNLVSDVTNGFTYYDQIQNKLKNKIQLSPDSTYQPSNAGKSNKVSLLQYLQDHGWDIPTRHEQLVNLANALSTPTPKAAVNGNLGGALDWPTPLDQGSQEQLRADIQTGKLGDISLHPFTNVLDYLLDNRPLSAEEQRNPRRLIDKVINSPKGKALARAIQTAFAARLVKGTASDWLLAALSVGSNAHSADGTVEGYRLVSAANTGKTASAVVKELTDNRVSNGNFSSPEVAAVHAHLMLASRAPAFLVKDIPDQVVVGTHSWVSFATAVARIEAKAPGATATMSYTQVMLHASIAPITAEEREVEYAAQHEAIKDWAVANGMHTSTDAEMNDVRKAFDAQLSELRAAAETQIGEMPTMQSVTQDPLKTALPDMDPAAFDKKCITLQPSNRHFPGPYSIRDLYIDGRALLGVPDSADNWGDAGRSFLNVFTLGHVKIAQDGKPARWISSSEAIDINLVLPKLKKLLPPEDSFNKVFSNYATAVTKTTSAQLKHLISKQPLEDRQNLEFGKITIRREIDYDRPDLPLRVTQGALLLETERNGNVMTYEINRLTGTVTRRPDKTYKEYSPTDSNVYSTRGKKYDVIKPTGQHAPDVEDERKGAQGTPYSFGSARTQYIVDALIEDMDLPAVRTHAKGATTFETEVPTYKIVQDVALGLIPFWSAIQNLKAGNIGDGVVDLAFDIFGFAVGIGSAVTKGAKAIASTPSVLSKIAKTGTIIGRAAVGALNPLDGIDDLGRGVLKLGRIGIGATYRGVKYLRGSHRSVNLLELAKKPNIAEGTYKTANGASQTTTLAQFDPPTRQWYDYDPHTQQAYGKPLDAFVAVQASAPHGGEIKGLTDSWLGRVIGSVVAPAADNPHFRSDYLKAITRAKAEDNAAYIAGLNTGKPEAIYGYSTALTIDDIKRLAVAELRTPKQLGSLVKRIEELDVLPERLATARQTAQIVKADEYKYGYKSGKPEHISGFSYNLTNNQIAELVIARGRTPEETGHLIGYIEKRRIEISRQNYAVFSADMTAAGGKVQSLPQGFYLSQVSLLSDGECAALSNAYALAAKYGKEDTLITNLHIAMTDILSPQEIAELRKTNPAKATLEQTKATKITTVREQLNTLQNVLGTAFHHGMQERQVSHIAIISELAQAGKANRSKTLLINGPGHGVTAGYDARTKVWFYFDPNFGKATFTTASAMSAALDSTLNSGRTQRLMPHYVGTPPGAPEYKISVFDESNLNATIKPLNIDMHALFRTLL